MHPESTPRSSFGEIWIMTPASQKLTMSSRLPFARQETQEAFAAGIVMSIDDALRTQPSPNYDPQSLREHQRASISFIRDELAILERGSLRYALYRQALMERYKTVGLLATIYESARLAREYERNVLELGLRDQPGLSRHLDNQRQLLDRQNRLCYGTVDGDTFTSLVKLRMGRFNSEQFVSQASKRVHEELLLLMPRFEPRGFNEVSLEPSAELLDFWRPHFFQKLGPFIDMVPQTENKISPPDLTAIFQQGINHIAENWGFERARRWQARLCDKGNVRVDIETEGILVPHTRAPLSVEDAKKLVPHELLHLIRHLLGGLSSEPLAATGFAGYEPFEEAFCKFAEMTIGGRAQINGVHYLIAGLSQGIDGRERSQREVFEIIWRLNALPKLAELKERPEDTILKTKINAAKTCERVFRGWPGLYLADLKYVQGAVAVNDVMASLIPDMQAGNERPFNMLFGAKFGHDSLHWDVLDTMSWPTGALETVGKR